MVMVLQRNGDTNNSENKFMSDSRTLTFHSYYIAYVQAKKSASIDTKSIAATAIY